MALDEGELWKKIGYLEQLEKHWADNLRESRLHAAREEEVLRALAAQHAEMRTSLTGMGEKIDDLGKKFVCLDRKIDETRDDILKAKGAKSMFIFLLGVVASVAGFVTGKKMGL